MAVRKYFPGDVYSSNFCGDFEVLEYQNSKRVLIRFLDTGYEYWTSVTRIVKGEVKDRTLSRSLFGFGINDVEYVVEASIDGKRVTCPFYRCWRNMFARCYSENTNPCYTGCSVDPRWYRLSNFKAWMETQDWQGKHLDKDLLVEGNKVYGPDTCLFVSPEVNQFIVTNQLKERDMPIGVTRRSDNIYIAQCGQGGTSSYIGSYKTPEEAQNAWKAAKQLAAARLASEQHCVKISEALLRKFA